MRKRVTELRHQTAVYETTTTHTFRNRVYEVDDSGAFYRAGVATDAKPDEALSKTFGMTDDNGEPQRFKLHQIILQTFMPDGIADGVCVDHMNKDRLDNSIANLRWATRKEQNENRENVTYKQKPVHCHEIGVTFGSCKEAEAALGLNHNTVARVARRGRKHSGGYTFSWSGIKVKR